MSHDDYDDEQDRIHETLTRIFPDKRNYSKVVQDLEELSTLGTEEISFSVFEIAVGLRLNLKISAKCLKMHGISFRRFNGDATVDFVLMHDYPFDSPRIYFQNTFCYPSLADGRDFFSSVMSQIEWHSQIGVSQVFNEVINYLKQISRRVQDVEYLMKEGVYQVGEEYDMEYFLNLSTCELFSSQEIMSKKKFVQKILVLTHYRLLEFQLSTTSNRTGILEYAENLSDLISFGVDKKSKDNRIHFKWQLANGNKKKHRESEFLIDQDEKFLAIMNERVEQVQKLSTKMNIAEEEVTLKYYETMDLDQILENITIMESELAESISLSAIDTLMVLYQKAIEFLSAVADPSYKLFVNKLHELLMREDVSSILKSKELGATPGAPTTATKKKTTKAVDPKNLPSDEFDSIFGELTTSIQISGESAEQQKQRKEAELRKVDEFRARVDLSNRSRYTYISQVKSPKFTDTLYYDATEKRKIVRVQYNQSSKAEFLKDISGLYLLPGVLSISELRRSSLTQQNLLYILHALISKIKILLQANVFISDIKPANVFLIPKSPNGGEYTVDFGFISTNLTDDKEYPTVFTKAFMNPELDEKLSRGEPIARHEIIQNQLYMIARTLQFVICKEEFEHSKVGTFVSSLSESKHGATLKRILYMLLSEKMVNDIDFILSEIEREESMKIPTSFVDAEGSALFVQETEIKEGIKKIPSGSVQQFEERHALGEKAMYLIDTIGGEYYPLFPQLMHEKLGTFKEILEKSEEMIAVHTASKMPASNRLLDSIIKLLKHQGQEGCLEEEQQLPSAEETISKEEAIVFLNLLALKAILFKWNGQLKIFKQYLVYAKQICESLIGKDHPMYAMCLLHLGQAETINGQVKEGFQHLLAAYQIRKNLMPQHPSTVYALLTVAESLRTQEKFDQALMIHEKINAEVEEMSESGQNQICVGRVLLSHARTLKFAKKYNEAYELISTSIDAIKKRYGEESTQMCEAYSETADLFSIKHQPKDALSLNEKSLSIIKNIFGDSHPIVADHLVNVSYTLRNMKNFDQSMNNLIAVMEIRKKFFGESHPIIADTFTEQANTLTFSNQFKQATDLHKLALSIRENLYGLENATTLSSLEAIMFEEASEYQAKVIEAQEKFYGEDCLQLARFLEKIAFQYEQNKNFEAALPYHQRVLEIREKRAEQDSNHQRLQAMLNLSYCQDQCRLFEDSLKQKISALAVMREQLGSEHKKVAHQLMSIAETSVQLEKTSEAFDALVEALALIHKKGLDKTETTKCLRVMTSLLVCEGEKGNMEGAFSLSEKVVEAVKKEIPEDPSYAEFLSAQCSEILGNLLDLNA